MAYSLSALLAATALLAAPGPTNVLFAAAGAVAGVRRSLRLVPVGLAAYALSVGLLVLTLGDAAGQRPMLGLGLQFAAAVWLGWTAVRLWRGAAHLPAATPLRLFWTTCLNPKALILGFGFYPQLGGAKGLVLLVPIFSFVALGWLAAGRSVMRLGRDRRRVAQATALANALFATLVVGSLVRAIA